MATLQVLTTYTWCQGCKELGSKELILWISPHVCELKQSTELSSHFSQISTKELVYELNYNRKFMGENGFLSPWSAWLQGGRRRLRGGPRRRRRCSISRPFLFGTPCRNNSLFECPFSDRPWWLLWGQCHLLTETETCNSCDMHVSYRTNIAIREGI